MVLHYNLYQLNISLLSFQIQIQLFQHSFQILFALIYSYYSNNDNRVALECDGERWHGEDKLEEDMNRQAILERLGWRFIRIRGSEFFSDENKSMENIVKKLNDFEIYPEENNMNLDDDNFIKNKIICRAQEIRESWYIKNNEE